MTTLTLTPLGHSCVLIEVPGDRGSTRILLDPGSLTPPLAPIDGLDAILITHAHPDHLTAEQIRAVRGDADVPVYGDAASRAIAEDGGIDGFRVVEPGSFTIGDVEVEVSVWEHEEIYPGVPLPPDLGYLVAGTVFAPGDAFAKPEHDVEVLLLPTGAPWMKLSETIDYLRAVAPRIAIPVHDGGLAPAHRQMHRSLMTRFAPEGTTVLAPSTGEGMHIPAASKGSF